jgi:hypothetical protein
MPFPVSFRSTGIRFLTKLCPPEGSAAVAIGSPDVYRCLDLDGVATFRTREIRPGRVPSVPRGRRYSHDRRCVSSRRLPFHNGQPLTPQHNNPSRGLA